MMKTKYPNLTSYILAILLFALALFASTLINKGSIKIYFPFIAPILLFIATWYLYKIEWKSIKELGLEISFKNVGLLILGTLLAAFIFLLAKFLRSLVLNESFNLAKDINYTTMLYALYTILPTVAVEEFIFRGYLFKKTIQLTSVAKANIIFAILFTSIHVLDDTVLSKPGMLILLLISIPVGHLLFSTALLKSNSLWLPIGLHLGNNWATRHLVSIENNGESIFYITDNYSFDSWTGFISFLMLWNLIYLLFIVLIWKCYTNLFKRKIQ